LETSTYLKQLSQAAGPSGHESTVRQLIRELWAPFADEIRTDALGNLIALQKAKSPTASSQTPPALMVAVHMDEIGLIVTSIERGFLHIGPIGGADPRVLLGQEVTVHGEAELPGVIGSRPPHVLRAEDRKKVPSWEQFFVDLGLPEEIVRTKVHVGDAISIRQTVHDLQNERVAGKTLDNRASVTVLTLALEALHTCDHAWDLYAVATVQEEVGLQGAITSAYGIMPQAAIAMDVTFGLQANDNAPGAFELDQGPTIGIGPNLHPYMVRKLREMAEREEIPYQLEPLPGHSGTDAWGIQVAREGIPTGLLSIPLRYMHQPVEMLALRDIERTARLLTAFIRGLAPDERPTWEEEA